MRHGRQLFAAKSEVGGLHQKDMFFDEAEALGAQGEPAAEETDERTVDVPGHKRAKRGRKPLDPAMPREVVRHELPEGERECPHDGAALREIGVEVSEQLDIVPQQVRVIRHERVKYTCPCCDGGMRLAARPPQVIPRGLYTEAAMSWVISSKYLDGLPLYRQAALLGRFGGADTSRNTLACSVVRVGEATQPVVNLLRDWLLEAPLVYGDETEVQVLKEAGRAPKTKSFMWAQMTEGSGPTGTGPPIVLFAYSPSRGMDTARHLYEGMREGGVLMTDGYEPYNAIAKAHKLVHLACWAHCRRGYHKALQALPKDSLLGKALHYTASQWPKLTRFVEDGTYPIDNNACENAIRPFCVGRRNWLFSDTVGGANASANLYSLLQTCKVDGIDGYQYLRELLVALPLAKTVDDYEALLPWRLTPRRA